MIGNESNEAYRPFTASKKAERFVVLRARMVFVRDRKNGA